MVDTRSSPRALIKESWNADSYPTTPSTWVARRRLRSSASRRLFPEPGTPEMRAAAGLLSAFAFEHTESRRASSTLRPTKPALMLKVNYRPSAHERRNPVWRIRPFVPEWRNPVSGDSVTVFAANLVGRPVNLDAIGGRRRRDGRSR